jgi:predicted GNAT family acetyltransferase
VLGDLTPPDDVPGALRRAGDADVGLAAGWMRQFVDETGLTRPSDLDARARTGVDAGRLHLWEIDGNPTCMVGNAPPVAGVARIGPVYTPPEHRRRGYAGAATAAHSRQLLDAGAHACMLYTDLANPTSNAVYQRIGYRPIADHMAWRFGIPAEQ